MNMIQLFCFSMWVWWGQMLIAEPAATQCQITVELKNYPEAQVRLAYYLADQLYIRDSIVADKKGRFIYKSKDLLRPGMYAIVLAPDNRGLEFLVNAHDQKFTIKGDVDDLFSTLQFEGSIDNTLFNDYIHRITTLRPLTDSLRQLVHSRKEANEPHEEVEKELKKLNEQIKEHQQTILRKHPNTLTASILRSQQTIDIPTFSGTDEEVARQQYLYRRDHYFDSIRNDTAFFRTKAFNGMVQFYQDKLVVPQPDSIAKGLDEVLGMIEKDEPLFRYYFISNVNKYGKMKVVGHDAVYVHLVEQYIKKGRTPFLPEEEQTKAITAADKARPTLIGQIAPDMAMKQFDVEATLARKDEPNEHHRFVVGKTIPLHQVDSAYTILFFWKPDCSSCKKAMPKMVEFYEKYKDKGVEVYAATTKYYKDLPTCAELLQKHQATDWINVADPYYSTKFMNIYHVESTPRIYILDRDKKILMNRIGAEQLEEVMNGIMNIE